MEKIKESQIIKTVKYTLTEFREIIRIACGEHVHVSSDLDGIEILVAGEGICDSAVMVNLSEYFGVKVKRFFSDGLTPEPNIWIAFEEKPKNRLDIYKSLKRINDSIMLDAGTVAKLTTPTGDEVSLEVRGDIKIITYDKNGKWLNAYYSFSEMPRNLQKKIIDGSYLNDEKIRVQENNWFEVFGNNGLKYDVVDAENSDIEDIYEILMEFLNYCKEKRVVPVNLNSETEIVFHF